MNALNLRERRLLAVGMLVALFALGWLIVVAPILSGFDERAMERESLLATYARNSAAIDTIPAARAQASRQRHDDARFSFPAPTPTAASDQLKEWLGGQLRGAGGELKAVQEVSSGGGWVRVWAEGALTLPQLTTLLERIENGKPYVIVESLTVAADRSFQTGRLDLMNVRVEVTGAYTASAPR